MIFSILKEKKVTVNLLDAYKVAEECKPKTSLERPHMKFETRVDYKTGNVCVSIRYFKSKQRD